MTTHAHCDRCFQVDCLEKSSCPLIYCPNGCFARMHECKRADHENICPHTFVPCLNVNYGCPLTIRRSDLTRHLHVCSASITVCPYTYNHEYHFDSFDNSKTLNFVQQIARRDQIWFEHKAELDEQQKLIFEPHKKRYENKPSETLIRSEKYPYITMQECMLSRGNSQICSTCRKRLRQLEEDEDQRLTEMTDGNCNFLRNIILLYLFVEERKLIKDHLPHSFNSSQTTMPSLVQMSRTLIDSTDISNSSNSSSTLSNSSSVPIEPMPIISDLESSSSYIYRLNYFSSHQYPENVTSLNKSLRFPCLALCRRDEFEQHCLIHLFVDCFLNTYLIQQCPKSQYGCQFQYEHLQPCLNNGQPMRLRFDEKNDAIAFELHSNIPEDNNQRWTLLDLPAEILQKILLKLDSLSLRNLSLVCRVSDPMLMIFR